ncbi:GspD family T2SS secretin variant LspD [soil metagenome]
MLPSKRLRPLPPRTARRARSCAVAIALVALMAFVVQTAFGAQAATLSTLNFPDIEVEGAARAMAAILDRQIVLDPRVKGKMTLYTEQAVTPAQAYAIFAANLRGLGFALVESGGLLMVLPEAEAKLQAGAATRAAREGDRVVTQVFRLMHENANNLVPVLRPLITANNTINVNTGNNSLVITDYANNLVRLGTLIAALDTPSATDTEVMPLQYALAADLAVTVQRLTEGPATSVAQGGAAPVAATAAGAGLSTSIMADTRINALLVRAPNPARLASIRALVAQLDRPGSSGAGGSNIHVIYLQNVEATRLATVLRAALPADKERGGGTGSAASANTGGSASSSSGASGSNSAAGTTSGASTSAATTPIASTAQPSIGGYIQADPATNSLVVTAPEPLFREVRAVVDLLDSQRAQLYVESLVVEVDASRALDIGLQWKQIFNIGNTTELTLGTVATALESMAGTNILSTANVVTLENEEAKIVVGKSVPFVTGSYTTTTSSSPFQTIERKDVGVTLRIRPQIGRNGAIRLTIQQESSSVASTSATSGPTTNKRSIESTVVVNDGKIIVLGGLIEDSYTTSADQIPLLADLPYVGGLFRTLSRARKKTNLVVFLRPVVMHDADETQRLSLDRYDYIHARQRELPADERGILRDAEMPLMPALVR